ncbi:MAG: hypothetical protein KAJ12_05375 [Bacteroidetes bacterium]|nr:hypothetical protein [Bacteroidota bacterium]
MQLSTQATALLNELDVMSRHKLSHRHDLGLLIELANQHKSIHILESLSFLAKFVSRTYRIMQRIGADAEGYDNLETEFGENLDKGRSLLRTLLEPAPIEAREHFETTFLTMNPVALENLLALYYDLSWYKNWLIDNRRTAE